MKLELGEFVAILEEIATNCINDHKQIDEYGGKKVPTYAEFEQHLIQNFGVSGKNQIVDQDKWLAYVLTRT